MKKNYFEPYNLTEIIQSIRKPLELAFSPASIEERIVFGAHMPGYGARSIPKSVVMRWISFMKERGIVRVCSLLAKSQLSYYLTDLIGIYIKEFGNNYVLHSPIEDYHLCSEQMLKRILHFLKDADTANEPVVVHCAGGRGRTGFVHAAWLVYGRSFSIERALEDVIKMGRNPFEAIEEGNASQEDLYRLLNKDLL